MTKPFGPILYCGDPHGQFRHIIKAALDLRASAVVLLGDMESAKPLHLELEPILDRTWFIHGNHDTDSDAVWANTWQSELAVRNIGGRVVTLPDGTRVAGLGGVFRGAVWYPEPGAPSAGAPAFRTRADHAHATPQQDRWHGSVHRKHWSTIYPEDIDYLAQVEADVLVSHEAPGYHPHGFGLLDTLAQAMGVKVTVHGHHHDNLDSSAHWPVQGFRSYGVGLRGITSIDLNGVASVILPGELDDERRSRSRPI